MRSRSIDASLFLLAAIVLLLAGGIILAVITLRSDPLEEIFSQDRVINSLFIIEKDKKPLSSFVLLFYPGTKRAAVFEIPGEVGLIIQQINRVDRIDTVYNPQKPQNFEKEVEHLLGTEVDYTMVFSLENLGKIVDLIEGVDLFVPAPVRIYDETPPILFPSGLVRLDGDKSLRYITYGLAEEDPEMPNFRRQRFFMGFIKRLGERNEYLKIPAIARIFQPLIGMDVNQRTRNRLFDELSGIDMDRVNVQTVAGNTREVSGQTLIFPFYDGSLIKEVVRQTLSGLTRQVEGALTERVFTVEILNGTPTSGLARRTAELLQGFGFDVITIGNADQSDYAQTEIIDRSGVENMVTVFADIIRCRNIRSEGFIPAELDTQNFEYKADFTLIIGRDFNGRYVTSQ